jgi:S1/P1 Nuclease
MKQLAALVFFGSFVGIQHAYSWWETGHEVVARIAAAHLTPAAHTCVARILNVPDNREAVADALAVASLWADQTKSQTHTSSWHYIDLALQDDKSDIPGRCPHENCAPARVGFFAGQLGSAVPDRRWSELDALRYLVHLVGDIHQPLHAVSNADLGGLCERLIPPVGQAKNLHALWDGGIIERMDHSARSLAAELTGDLEEWSRVRRDEAARGDQNDWVWESHLLAERHVYHRLHLPLEPVVFPRSCNTSPIAIREAHPPIDGLYIADMKPIIRLQLQKGGLRLARLLNETL